MGNKLNPLDWFQGKRGKAGAIMGMVTVIVGMLNYYLVGPEAEGAISINYGLPALFLAYSAWGTRKKLDQLPTAIFTKDGVIDLTKPPEPPPLTGSQKRAVEVRKQMGSWLLIGLIGIGSWMGCAAIKNQIAKPHPVQLRSGTTVMVKGWDKAAAVTIETVRREWSVYKSGCVQWAGILKANSIEERDKGNMEVAHATYEDAKHAAQTCVHYDKIVNASWERSQAALDEYLQVKTEIHILRSEGVAKEEATKQVLVGHLRRMLGFITDSVLATEDLGVPVPPGIKQVMGWLDGGLV